jgi:diacylglycerol kinase family enzyme
VSQPILIFANPTSGRGRGVLISELLVPALTAADYRPGVVLNDPTHFDDAAAVTAARALIVIGGDGTLRAVIDRCLAIGGDAELPPVLFIGLGTANLMQRHLGLKYPKDDPASRVIELLAHHAIRPVDIGTANGRVFLLMTSCGYDAGVVHNLANVRRGPITKLSYVAPALRHLRDQAYTDVTVTVDGRVVHSGGPAQVFVGNVAEYGTGFPVLIEADSADGVLDVCVLPCASHAQFAQMVWRLVSGGHRAAPGVVYLRGRDVTIEAATPQPVQIDGDAAGMTPVRLGLLPRRVDFIVP